jgi:hypothetical protein
MVSVILNQVKNLQAKQRKYPLRQGFTMTGFLHNKPPNQNGYVTIYAD